MKKQAGRSVGQIKEEKSSFIIKMLTGSRRVVSKNQILLTTFWLCAMLFNETKTLSLLSHFSLS
jgi:hypothetical protein